MPRRTLSTQNFNPAPAGSPNQDIVAALGKHSLTDVVQSMEEVGQTLKSTHLGHELHLWEAEVEAEG